MYSAAVTRTALFFGPPHSCPTPKCFISFSVIVMYGSEVILPSNVIVTPRGVHGPAIKSAEINCELSVGDSVTNPPSNCGSALIFSGG